MMERERRSLATSAMSHVHTGQLSRAMARLQSHGVHISNDETAAQASQKFSDEIHTMPSAERSTIHEKAYVSHDEVWQTTFRVSSNEDSCDLRMAMTNERGDEVDPQVTDTWGLGRVSHSDLHRHYGREDTSSRSFLPIETPMRVDWTLIRPWRLQMHQHGDSSTLCGDRPC